MFGRKHIWFSLGLLAIVALTQASALRAATPQAAATPPSFPPSAGTQQRLTSCGLIPIIRVGIRIHPKGRRSGAPLRWTPDLFGPLSQTRATKERNG